jgi:hypothetical protein
MHGDRNEKETEVETKVAIDRLIEEIGIGIGIVGAGIAIEMVMDDGKTY